ncbi:thermonuclease family protein [Desulfopila sp. IMCC35006]|uniref:thermonuclease family protein n=1 Tax=Desulfopila sp. IMCC35006 TaxID=2569542 RepID=UPI00142E9D7E|nr:thermonuclease family protein [Desulfopila sp. IMCC35006]
MMRKTGVIVAVLLAVSACPAFAGEPFWGSVKKIIDGDSLLIVSGKRTIEIRLYGIDSPEYNQPFAGKAKKLVKRKVFGKRILVRPVYYDSYQRLVAVVEYNDRTLNSELVNAGLAWVYPQYCRKKICRSWQQLEASAKANRKGLWSAARPIPPWQWRERRHH